jgi:hypothetical protein
MPENKRIRPVSVAPPTPPLIVANRSVDCHRTAPPQAEWSPFRGLNQPRSYATSAQTQPNRSMTIVDKVALAMTFAALLNDEPMGQPDCKGERDDRVRSSVQQPSLAQTFEHVGHRPVER